MVEKIFITPGNVRGLGNIVSVKGPGDFSGNYSNLIVDSEGNFVLSYQGLLLKFTSTVRDTVKDTVASLLVTVSLEEDGSLISDLTVSCTFEDSTVLTGTTDGNGLVVFNWTPTELGETTLTIHCDAQGTYAEHTGTVDVRVGVLLSFNLIMTRLTCEDDEYYLGQFEPNIEHRNQLETYIQNIFVAEGGERCVTESGLVYVATPGDLVVEYNSIDQLEGYENVLFEEEVDQLTNAVCGMSITSNNDIVLTRLEREDIIGESDVGSISLSVDDSSLWMIDTGTLTASVLDVDGEPLEECSVGFFKDNVLLGSSMSDSTGKATFNFEPDATGTFTFFAKAGGVNSNNVSIRVTKTPCNFRRFEVSPSTAYVGDSIAITGTLTVQGNRPVLIYDGDSLLTTLYMDGHMHFTGSVNTLSAGSHTLKAVFEEDDYYVGAESETVTVTVSKITPTLSLSASSSSVTVGDSFTLSGTLSVGSGQSVLLYRDDHYVETLTTGTGGAFSKTMTETSVGSYSYYVLFESTSKYTRVQSSSVSVTVLDDEPVWSKIMLTSDKDVLSYYDSDSCTLFAQLVDGSGSSVAVSGETVSFMNGTTSLGTATTDSTGLATLTYQSQGIGDMSIRAYVGTIFSETYELEDTVRYDSASSDKVSQYTVPSGLSMSFDTDHYLISSPTTSRNFIDFVEVGLDDFEFSALINTTNRNMGLAISTDSSHTVQLYGVSSGTGLMYINGGSGITERTSSILANNQWYKYTLRKEGETYTGVIETLTGTTFGTWTVTVADFTKAQLVIAWSGSMQIKDLKVKVL